MADASRTTDEELLEMLRMRRLGMSLKEIVTKFGRTVQYVSVATNRVARADAKESSEDVTDFYWPGAV